MAALPSLPVTYGVPYKVKFGKSFSDRNNNAFHTISYDFKPMSVDYSKPARMRVSEDEVIVSVPNTQAESDDDVTQFRGGKKICQKECVLIINTKTKEATLERVINSVQLKVLRPAKEKSKVPSKLPDRSISPLPNPPANQSLKLCKLAGGSLRSQSPLGGRPLKKKKKASSEAVAKEESSASLLIASHDPVVSRDPVSQLDTHKAKPDPPKPSKSSYTTSQPSFSSSLSSSESDMEEVSVPTVAHGNTMTAMPVVGMREKRSRSSVSSSSDSDSGGSSGCRSQSVDDSDEEDNPKQRSPRRQSMSVLHNDLHLSDPSSESDSE